MRRAVFNLALGVAWRDTKAAMKALDLLEQATRADASVLGRGWPKEGVAPAQGDGADSNTDAKALLIANYTIQQR
jgi:hypothetical protein